MSIELKQKELNDVKWQINNFGKHEDDQDRVFQGMVEELGEMAHSLLKFKQNIYINDPESGDDVKFYKLQDNVADAFGDIVIYGIQLMTTCQIDAEKAISDTIIKVLKRNWRENLSGTNIDKE
jgi:NTP pyrophosphatase (non-canonical NTP hydrolase)